MATANSDSQLSGKYHQNTDKFPDAMGAWKHDMHRDAPDPLVQLVILHAEIEALHPFLDSNGRLGPTLVLLRLRHAGLVTVLRFLRVLREGEILKLVGPGRGRRASMLIFPALLNVVEGRKVF